jgi:hypothetical protein
MAACCGVTTIQSQEQLVGQLQGLNRLASPTVHAVATESEHCMATLEDLQEALDHVCVCEHPVGAGEVNDGCHVLQNGWRALRTLRAPLMMRNREAIASSGNTTRQAS